MVDLSEFGAEHMNLATASAFGFGGVRATSYGALYEHFNDHYRKNGLPRDTPTLNSASPQTDAIISAEWSEVHDHNGKPNENAGKELREKIESNFKKKMQEMARLYEQAISKSLHTGYEKKCLQMATEKAAGVYGYDKISSLHRQSKRNRDIIENKIKKWKEEYLKNAMTRGFFSWSSCHNDVIGAAEQDMRDLAAEFGNHKMVTDGQTKLVCRLYAKTMIQRARQGAVQSREDTTGDERSKKAEESGRFLFQFLKNCKTMEDRERVFGIHPEDRYYPAGVGYMQLTDSALENHKKEWFKHLFDQPNQPGWWGDSELVWYKTEDIERECRDYKSYAENYDPNWEALGSHASAVALYTPFRVDRWAGYTPAGLVFIMFEYLKSYRDAARFIADEEEIDAVLLSDHQHSLAKQKKLRELKKNLNAAIDKLNGETSKLERLQTEYDTNYGQLENALSYINDENSDAQSIVADTKKLSEELLKIIDKAADATETMNEIKKGELVNAVDAYEKSGDTADPVLVAAKLTLVAKQIIATIPGGKEEFEKHIKRAEIVQALLNAGFTRDQEFVDPGVNLAAAEKTYKLKFFPEVMLSADPINTLPLEIFSTGEDAAHNLRNLAGTWRKNSEQQKANSEFLAAQDAATAKANEEKRRRENEQRKKKVLPPVVPLFNAPVPELIPPPPAPAETPDSPRPSVVVETPYRVGRAVDTIIANATLFSDLLPKMAAVGVETREERALARRVFDAGVPKLSELWEEQKENTINELKEKIEEDAAGFMKNLSKARQNARVLEIGVDTLKTIKKETQAKYLEQVTYGWFACNDLPNYPETLTSKSPWFKSEGKRINMEKRKDGKDDDEIEEISDKIRRMDLYDEIWEFVEDIIPQVDQDVLEDDYLGKGMTKEDFLRRQKGVYVEDGVWWWARVGNELVAVGQVDQAFGAGDRGRPEFAWPEVYALKVNKEYQSLGIGRRFCYEIADAFYGNKFGQEDQLKQGDLWKEMGNFDDLNDKPKKLVLTPDTNKDMYVRWKDTEEDYEIGIKMKDTLVVVSPKHDGESVAKTPAPPEGLPAVPVVQSQAPYFFKPGHPMHTAHGSLANALLAHVNVLSRHFSHERVTSWRRARSLRKKRFVALTKVHPAPPSPAVIDDAPEFAGNQAVALSPALYCRKFDAGLAPPSPPRGMVRG